MGHTKPELIEDLEAELASLRTLSGIKEKKPGVFYWKSVPFLHFHDKDGNRWADIKTLNGDWVRTEISFDAKSSAKARFLKTAKAAHQSISGQK
jgi:hypothetical protein